jgi:hypothetical protein
MRKLVVLMLVLGMASLANAAIVSSIQLLDNGGGLYSIILPSGMSNVIDSSGGYFFVTGVNPLSGAVNAGAPDASGVLGNSADFGFDPGVLGFIGSYAAIWSAPANSIPIISLAGTAPAIRLYTISDEFTNPVLRSEILVPEPATLALLGLGGILLRKRKA